MYLDGTGNRNLTNHPSDDGTPSLAPDQRRIVFSSNRDGRWRLYVMDQDGSDQTRLTEGPNDGWPAWSPDGQSILYVSQTDNPPTSHLRVINADGSRDRRLGTMASVSHAAWSPDSSTIAVSTKGSILLVDAFTGAIKQELLNDSYYDDYPAWSPNGRYLAFASSRASADDSRLDLFWMELSAPQFYRQVGTNDKRDQRYPSWAQDERLVYAEASTYGSADTELYITNSAVTSSDTWTVRRLTQNRAIDNHPTLSPRGGVDTCAAGEPLALESERVSDNRHGMSIDINVPQITVPSCDSTRWANERFRRHLSPWLTCAVNPAGDNCFETIVGRYVTTVATTEFVSVRFTVSGLRRGMAHHLHMQSSLNLDLRTQREVQLSEVFTLGADYLGTLSRLSIAQLTRRVGDVYNQSEASLDSTALRWIQEGAAATPQNYDVWNLSENDLIVTFTFYQVAPYAYGPQEVVIPLRALEPILRPDGPFQRVGRKAK